MQLYRKNRFEKITVGQIAEKAGITRSTFYVYYDSIFSLLESIEKDLIKGLGPYFEDYSSSILERNDRKPYDSTVHWFEFCKENQYYLSVLLGPNGDPSFEYRLRKQLKADINRMMDRDGMKNDYLRKYAVEYVAGATLSLTRFWVDSRENLSAEEIALIADLIRHSNILPPEEN